MRYIQIFLQMTSANIRGMMTYKVDFLVSFFAGLFSQTACLIFLGILFGNIPSVAGWSGYEVAILHGYILVSEGVLTLFFQGTNGLWRQVKIGTFDRYMIRPLPVPLQIYSYQTNLAGAGTAATGLAVILYSMFHIEMVVSPWNVALFIPGLLLGSMIRVNINFAASCLCVITEGGIGENDAIYKLQELAKYPVEIYPRMFRLILVSLLPFSAISYIPTAVYLNRIPSAYWLMLPAASGLILLIRKWLFQMALDRYDGAGS